MPGRANPHAIEIAVRRSTRCSPSATANRSANGPCSENARWYPLDQCESVADPGPELLIIRVPASERSRTDEQAVKTALRANLLAHTGSYLKAARFSHRERLCAFIGIAILLLSIALSDDARAADRQRDRCRHRPRASPGP